MSDNVKIVTDASWEADVLKADKPVLVDFWAPWCGPCRMVAPVIEEIATEYAGKVAVAKMNTDENPRVSQTYGIRSIPTVALFQDGAPVTGIVGAVPKKHFNEMLDKHLAASAGSAAPAK
jgi:thioredoxin 1